jgi:hypothetical protein
MYEMFQFVKQYFSYFRKYGKTFLNMAAQQWLLRVDTACYPSRLTQMQWSLHGRRGISELVLIITKWLVN